MEKVYLTRIQLALLPVIADIIEERAREPSNHKKINVNAHILKEKTGFSYNAIKHNLLKFKELRNE